MSTPVITASQIHSLQSFFGERLQRDEPMSRYSVMNVGGPADFLVPVTSSEESGIRGAVLVGREDSLLAPGRVFKYINQ